MLIYYTLLLLYVFVWSILRIIHHIRPWPCIVFYRDFCSSSFFFRALPRVSLCKKIDITSTSTSIFWALWLGRARFGLHERCICYTVYRYHWRRSARRRTERAARVWKKAWTIFQKYESQLRTVLRCKITESGSHEKQRWNEWENVVQARLAKNSILLASICHAITDPPVTKIRLWASFGV